MLLTKITVTKDVALSYHTVRGLYCLTVVFVATIELAEMIGRSKRIEHTCKTSAPTTYIGKSFLREV